MSSRTSRWIIALAVAGCLTAAGTLRTATSSAGAEAAAPVKWEYRVVSEADLLSKLQARSDIPKATRSDWVSDAAAWSRTVSETEQTEFNALGAQGWELVAVGNDGLSGREQSRFIFRRPQR